MGSVDLHLLLPIAPLTSPAALLSFFFSYYLAEALFCCLLTPNMEETLSQRSINSSLLLGVSYGLTEADNNSTTHYLTSLVGSSSSSSSSSSNNSISFLQLLECADTPHPSCYHRLQHQHEKKPPSPWEATLASCDVTNDTGGQVIEEGSNSIRCSEEGKPEEKRKRKRSKVAKNKDEIEGQRMAHIEVERNRRRQMNNHISTLRSLMPPSYVCRGDQASVVGGAIEFLKGLEQLLQSLEAKKSMSKQQELETESGVKPVLAASLSSSAEEDSSDGQSRIAKKSRWGVVGDAAGVRVIERHANVKVECEMRPGMLVKAIAGLEEMRLSVVHLNITSYSHPSLVCCLSFNLKIEDDCKIRSADEIFGAVQRVFDCFIGGQ